MLSGQRAHTRSLEDAEQLIRLSSGVIPGEICPRPRTFSGENTLPAEDRKRAILSALVQMDKQFGKGSVLLLGSQTPPVNAISRHSSRSITPSASAAFRAAASWRYSDPNPPVRRRLFTLLPKPRSRVGTSSSSMPSTPSTPATLVHWASTSTTLSFRSPTAANRRWRSPVCCRNRLSRSDRNRFRRSARSKGGTRRRDGRSFMGLHARLMSQALRKLTGEIAVPTPASSSSTSCGKNRRDVRQSGDHHRRPCPEVLLLSARRSPASRPLRMATRSSATARRSRWSRTRSLRFREAEVDLIHGEGISRKAICWTSAATMSSRKAAHGSASRASGLARDETMRAFS